MAKPRDVDPDDPEGLKAGVWGHNQNRGRRNNNRRVGASWREGRAGGPSRGGEKEEKRRRKWEGEEVSNIDVQGPV